MTAGEPEYLYLTTTGRRTGQPREIEIWFTASEGRYYLVAEHHAKAQWARNVRVDPRVRVRVGDCKFAATARPIDATAESTLHDAIRALSIAKYGWGDGLIVELTPAP